MINQSSKKLKKQLFGNKLSLLGLILVAILLLSGIFAPYISPYDPGEMMFEHTYAPPSADFVFGTDSLGRDQLSRVIGGARTSLIVGLGATLVALFIGVIFGGLAGFYGGWIETLFMRMADIQLSIPRLILLIVAAAVLGERGMEIIIVIIGISMWPSLGRVTRSKVMDLKTRDFVEAARASGTRNIRILWKHILPNGMGPIVVIATLDIGSAIIAEASLGFLGLSDPRVVSWGNMLSTGLRDMIPAPWTTIFPGIAIFLTVWGLNMFGDALRDILDVES